MSRPLVDFYKRAMENLLDSLDRNLWGVKENPRHLVLLAEVKFVLDRLDAQAGAWAEAMVRRQYARNIKFINDFLKVKGYTDAELQAARAWSSIHEDVIDLLINHPTTGIAPRLRKASHQLGQSIEAYVAQNKILLQQNRMLRGNIAMSTFMGEGAEQARNEILRTLMNNNAPTEFMGLQRWRGGSAAQSLATAPYLTVQTKKGSRRLHIFDHVQMTATTTANAVRTVARNKRIQEVGIQLVRITPNPPLTPCVCSLYAGRIFALDREVSEHTGFPLLADTPNGGPPFHPYCTHSTIPFIPEMTAKGATQDAFKNGDTKGTRTVRGGFPQALVGTDFQSAQKYFRKKGGIRWAVRQNPQLRSYSGSTMADPSVLDALKGRKRRIYRANDGSGLAQSDLPIEGSETGADILEDLI